MNAYYIAPNDQKQGPFSMAQLRSLLDAGKLKIGDLCWRSGMADWQPIQLVIPSLVDDTLPRPSQHVDATPKLVKSHRASAIYERRNYGGISRGAYWFISVFFGTSMVVLHSMLTQPGTSIQDSAYIRPIGIAMLIVSFISIFLRLRNIGVSRWWAGAVIVCPPLIIPMSFFCAICQEGYTQDKSLDGNGKVLAFLTAFIWIPALIAFGHFVYTTYIVLK